MTNIWNYKRGEIDIANTSCAKIVIDTGAAHDFVIEPRANGGFSSGDIPEIIFALNQVRKVLGNGE